MPGEQDNNDGRVNLPLSQIALSTIDLRRSDAFWRVGLGFLPSATSRMFRGPTISNLMRVEDAKTTTRWLVGQDEWLQIEIWQFENPLPSLQPPDHAPNHVGYSRCGVWVKKFDATASRLEAMGYPAVSPPVGEPGERRVCVRDPDGIWVELFERDPLSEQIPPSSYDSDAALRSITLSTNHFAASCQFIEKGVGLRAAGFELHGNEHESLWGLDDALCRRKTYGSAKMLLEVVEYQNPAPVPRSPRARLIDQGILNIAFGANRSVRPIRELEDQTIHEGAAPTERMITPLGGCVYVTDAQGFSYELTWAHPFLAQRIAGYFPRRSARFHTAENTTIECETLIAAPAETIWPHLADPELMSKWCTMDTVSHLKDGNTERLGVGAERKLIRGRHEMVEEIVAYRPCEEIRYRLARRGPFANLAGEMRLNEEGNKTRVTWVVRFRGKWPCTGWLQKLLLRGSYQQSLDKLNAMLSD